MPDTPFFGKPEEHSQVKASIVSKYFDIWAKIITRAIKDGQKNIAYVDLFSGPGKYGEGTKSTPLLILERAIDDPFIKCRLKAIFLEANDIYATELQNSIESIPGISSLKHTPEVHNLEFNENFVSAFEKLSLIPTFLFADPWGYKGISLRLINSILKDWACKCIFYFNYNRVNMGLTNPSVEKHINAIFGKSRANKMRKKIPFLTPYQREKCIVEEIENALRAGFAGHVLRYTFKNDRGTRTTHYLIFVTKHELGYMKMKEIMGKESSVFIQGVPTYEFNPAIKAQTSLISKPGPLDVLKQDLLEEFSGKRIKRIDIYNVHNLGKPYIERNYRDALIELENENKIKTNPPASKRRANTFAKSVVVTFPARKK